VTLKGFVQIAMQTHIREDTLLLMMTPINQTIEGLRERTEYVPQLWNWENHS